MAERIIANLTLDTYQRNKIPPLVIPQHDYGARYIRVRITEQGENVSVASGSVVSIIAKRMADGQSAAFSGSVNADGSVLVPVTQWMLDAPDDDVDCHVAVTGTGYQYSTTSFVISPQERENPSYLEEDDPRVNIVEEALIKVVEEADRAEEQADLAQSAASTAASDAKEAARQEVEQLVGQLGIVQTLGHSRMAVVSQEVTTGLYNRNAKRIANLEQGFNEQFETDDSVAYVKDVPENALPYAEVKKVGGMTRKCTNLIPFPYIFGGSATINGVTFTANSDGSITANGTSTEVTHLELGNVTFAPNTNYIMSGAVRGRYDLYLNNPYTPSWVPFSFDTKITTTVIIYIDANITFANEKIYPMLNEGSNALPYEPYFEGLRSDKVTEVESVGVNLLNIPQTFVKDSTYYGYDLFTGTVGSDTAVPQEKIKTLPYLKAGEYYFSYNMDAAIKDVYVTQVNNDGSIGTTYINYVGKFTVPHDTRITIKVYTNEVVTIKNIMLNEGPTAQPYTPYFNHTLPIPVEVRGSENLFNPAEIRDGYYDVTNNGAFVASGWKASPFIGCLPLTPYTISNIEFETPGYWNFYDINKNQIGYEDMLYNKTVTTPNGCCYLTFYGRFTGDVMLNEGTTALPYEPYSTVKGLDGYGLGVSDTVYNYIDWEKKQFVKRCASVDLGTLNFGIYSATDHIFFVDITGKRKGPINLLTGPYDTKANLQQNRTISGNYENSLVYIRDENYTDAETFKSAMSGVMLVYELATPEVTDISSLITEDNFIGVEGNGTLTFKNAYAYSVPSEVEYQLEV